MLLPGESQGREAWWAAIYGVAQSRTRLKRLSSSSSSKMLFSFTKVTLSMYHNKLWKILKEMGIPDHLTCLLRNLYAGLLLLLLSRFSRVRLCVTP